MNHRIFVKSNKNEVLLIYCSFSFFFLLKDKILKKLAAVFKFLYFLTILSLNFDAFCWFYLLVKIPLHCINLQREGTTLISAISDKIPIKSVTSH